jgi:hypothetical protein
MTTHILSAAIALSDGDLLARISALAGTEREATAELVAHLAALELRPSLYAAQGYGSLFDYCVRGLRLSEDAACNRIRVTRACRRFPVILDMLAAGCISLRSVRVLGPHLTTENHVEVLARAANRRHGDIEALAAELAPKPDVVASVRKLPQPNASRFPGPAMSSQSALGTSQETLANVTLNLHQGASAAAATPPSAGAAQDPDASGSSAPTTQDIAERGDGAFTMTALEPIAPPVPRSARPVIRA